MRPGQTLSTSAAVGYASTPFSLSLTGSYSHQTVTYVNQAPSFQAGDSITLSTLASLTVADWSAFNFTASYTNTAKNEALDPTSSLFFIQNDNANSNLFKADWARRARRQMAIWSVRRLCRPSAKYLRSVELFLRAGQNHYMQAEVEISGKG